MKRDFRRMEALLLGSEELIFLWSMYGPKAVQETGGTERRTITHIVFSCITNLQKDNGYFRQYSAHLGFSIEELWNQNPGCDPIPRSQPLVQDDRHPRIPPCCRLCQYTQTRGDQKPQPWKHDLYLNSKWLWYPLGSSSGTCLVVERNKMKN